MESGIVSDYFYNGKFNFVKKHITSSTGLGENTNYPLCRARNDGLMAASLVDVQNITNLMGGIHEIIGPVNSIQNYSGGIYTNSNLMYPHLASKQFFLDRLNDKVSYSTSDYCFVYYSGHGNSEGGIALSNGNVTSPEEVFNVSLKLNLPFFIVLDMCFAGRFGEKYQRLVREHNWKGIVLCSSRPNESSFEHGLMREIRFNNGPIIVSGVMTPNLLLGQGIFSAAFIVALNQVKMSGYNFTFKEFIDKINLFMDDIRNLINKSVTNRGSQLPIQRACFFK